MKLITNLILILSVLVLPAYAGGKHNPPPAPQNVPDGGSNHNALAIAVFIAGGVCVYHKCWQKKPEPFTKPEVVLPKR